ncbi:hypothetical protein RND81_11G199200 [Saponaria officinalis]|uniref:Cysteine proteinase inhibitor n=1 Tax=Saponaria officinalis TaxID=3572 RepID=A0AAW1HR00_SAPOF
MQKSEESQGFDVDDCPGYMPGRIVPISKETREWSVATKLAQYASIDFEVKMKHPPMKTVTVTKANYQPVGGLMYYISFLGVDSNFTQAAYQAKVWLKPGSKLETMFINKMDGSEIEVPGRKKRISNPNSRRAVSGFFAYLRSVREMNPTLRFKQARRKCSQCWKMHLTDKEKNHFIGVAASLQRVRYGSSIYGRRYSKRVPLMGLRETD